MTLSYNKEIKSRFIFTTLLLFSEQHNFFHSNLIIIDNKKKTFERFEPKGKYFADSKNFIYIDKKVNNIITNIFKNKIKLKSFKFVPQSEISPNKGIQIIANKNSETNNFCNVINMIYLNLRILYPDVEQKKIINYFTSMQDNDLFDILLKYAKFVENTLNDSYRTVNFLDSQSNDTNNNYIAL